MNYFDAVKKENIGKTYKIFIDGVNKGVWELKNGFSTEEFDFYRDGEPLTEIYFSSQLIRMRFKEVVDWSKIPVDTLVEVSDDGEKFIKRHFAKYERGMIFVWGDGRSSKTAYSENDVVKWEMANIIRI
jgi:hypothetical protein